MAIRAEIGGQWVVAFYAVAMAAVIVAVDFMFFKHRFLERLTVNISIVILFLVFYLVFRRAK
jgi:hypothetical protein